MMDTCTINAIAKNISFIPLETSRDALFTTAGCKVAAIHGNYYIWAEILHRKGIMEFDSEGRFVKYLVTFGRGPNELPIIFEFTYNTQQLVASSLREMVVHSFENKAIHKCNFGGSMFAFINLLNDGTIVGIPWGGTDIPYFYFRNQEGEILKSVYHLPQHDLFSSVAKHRGSYRHNLSRTYDGCVLFRELFCDTIYRIRSMDDIEPYIIAHRGTLAYTEEDSKSQTAIPKIKIGNILETPKHFFIRYDYNGYHSAVFDKQRLSFIADTKIDTTRIENRIISSATVFTKYRTPKGKVIHVGISSYNNGKLYGILNAEEAKEFLSGVDEFDNPLIMCIDLK